MDVAITGGSGTVGTAVYEYLDDTDTYTPVSVDVVGSEHRPTVEADVTDYWAMRDVFESVDAVVHLALIGGKPPLVADTTVVGWFDSLERNLRATCTVFSAAIDAGVEDFVFGSSIMIVEPYAEERAPESYSVDAPLLVDHDTPPRAESPYSATKLFGESIGRVSSLYHGLSVYAVRLGAVHPAGEDHPYHQVEKRADAFDIPREGPEYEREVKRAKSLWASRRDVGHLIECCLADDSVTFDTFYGLSDNTRRWVDLERTKDVLGYRPRDDGDDW
jgi:nucleoside-diphosphate-sugar epimerase